MLTNESKPFNLKEFNGIQPDPLLLAILMAMRSAKDVCGITINSSTRSIADHIAVYKSLESNRKIKTKSNGLGDKDLIDLIPWESRHLPKWGINGVVAVDFTVFVMSDKGMNRKHSLTGEETKIRILKALQDKSIKDLMKSANRKLDSVGIGVGSSFCHLDVDRTELTVWPYGY